MAKITKIDFDQPGPAIDAASNVLSKGGIVSFPTETFYGLGANAFNEEAVKNIFKVKGRAFKKPLLVLIPSKEQAFELTQHISETANKLMDCFWPGPLTLVFKASHKLPLVLTGNTGKVGIRVPGSSFVRQLCKACGFPITGSSANISNHSEATSAGEVSEALGDKIDLILDGGETDGGEASTVLGVSGVDPVMIRPGKIGQKEIEEVLGREIKL